MARFAFRLIHKGTIPRICEVLYVGARQRSRGCSPETLEEWKHSSKGYERSVCMVGWVAGPLSVRFSRPRHYFCWHRHSASKATFAPCEPIQTAHRACTGTRLTCGTSPPGSSRFFRGYGLCHDFARRHRAPAHVRAIRGTLVLMS